MIALLRGILAATRTRAIGSLALAVLIGLSEGVTLLLLFPLLQIAGVPAEGQVNAISASLLALLRKTGIVPNLVILLFLYVGATIAQASLKKLQAAVDAEVVQAYAMAIRTRLYSAIARAEWLVLSRIRSSDFTFALTTAVDKVEGGAYSLLYFIASLVIALVYIGLAIRLSPQMSGIVLGAGVMLIVIERARVLRGRKGGRDIATSTQELYATAAEQLGGLKTAKSYGQEERHLSLFLHASDSVNKANLSMTRTFAALRWRLAIGSVIALSLILYLAVEVLHLPTAAILLVLFLFSRLVPRLTSLQSTLQEVFSALPALETIHGLTENCERAPERRDSGGLPITLRQRIDLEDVSFSYDGRTNHLSGIDLTIPAGKTTAIVGPSGAGKSTLADILLGLLRPGTGKIFVDRVPLDTAHLKSWRDQIGYVAQDTFLFNESVRVNLDWANAGATESEMVAALSSAAAWDYVARLPSGIDTVIGERGVRLSGGERQRLSLARALLRHPRLLILDEATSALDSENEERIYKAVQELHGEATIVIITHRLSTIRGADFIHVLDDGKLVASGSWQTLMEGENTRFRELCEAQGIGPPVAR